MAQDTSAFALDPAPNDADTQRRKKLSSFGLAGLQQFANEPSPGDDSTALQSQPLYGGQIDKAAAQAADEPSQIATERVQRAPQFQESSPLLPQSERLGNVLTGEEGQYGPLTGQQREVSLKGLFGSNTPSSSGQSADAAGPPDDQTAQDIGQAKQALGLAGQGNKLASTLKGLFQDEAPSTNSAQQGSGSGVSMSDTLRSGNVPNIDMDLFRGFQEQPVIPGSDVPGLSAPTQTPDVLGGTGNTFQGIGGGLGTLTGLAGIAGGINKGGVQGALQGVKGGLQAASGLANIAQSGVAGEFAAGLAGELNAGAWGPYLAAAGEAVSIAQRAEAGDMPADQQAVYAALEVLALLGDIFGGGFGLYSAANMGVEAALGNLWAKYPSHEQRDTADEVRAQQLLSRALPDIQGAGTPQDLATSLTPLFKNQYQQLPYATVPGVGRTDYNMGLEGMMNLPSRDALASLFAGEDPNAIQFGWTQGTRPEFNEAMGHNLTQAVREQAAVIHAAAAGDPQAKQILKYYQDRLAASQADTQSRADEFYARQNRPWDFDPTWFQNLPTQGN